MMCRTHFITSFCFIFFLSGCQDMWDQPRFEEFERNSFYQDESSARPFEEGVIARGELKVGPLYSGKVDNQYVETLPIPLTEERLSRGRERFDIYCSVCHGRTGMGNGMVAQRGFKAPPPYHSERVRGLPIGHFFDVMTRGFGRMPSYAGMISPEDRWAIAAYIRALQLSQNARVSDVSAEERRILEQKP